MQLKDKLKPILGKDYPGEKAWKAFIYWWLDANGYDHKSRKDRVSFTDGANDGGIDAIAWSLENQTRNEVLVVQSKYFGQPPSENDLVRFREAKDAINGSLDDFDAWLDGCRDGLQPLYRKLREERRRCRFIIITPSRCDSGEKRALRHDGFEVHDVSTLVNLERNYSEGRTPRLDELRMIHASRPRDVADAAGTRVWIFTVGARELGALYEKHGDLLFAGNIRYALRGQTARRVRSGITDTLTGYPHEFVFSHNGITITGDGLKIRDKTVVMSSATIVNGAQTVSYLGTPKMMSLLRNSSARVIVKFVEVNDAEMLNDIESKVAVRANTQNKVDPSDLMIGLASLVSLQRYFRRRGMHLERKKGEQKLQYGEMGIAKERLAQVLAAIRSPEGAVKGKRKQDLFQQSACDLFSDYDKSEQSRAESVAWARVDAAFWSTIYLFANNKRRKRAQIAELAALTVFHRVLRETHLKAGFLRVINRWDDDKKEVQWFLQKSFKAIVGALLQYSAKHKKNEPAFYKAVESVKPAVKYATLRARRKIKDYYRDSLGS